MTTPVEEMKELIKEMQAGQAKSMEHMMTIMFDKMKESNIVAGTDTRRAQEPGQIDERKNIRGPDTWDGSEKKYQEWKTKMMVYLKLKVPESIHILKHVAKNQDKCISDETIRDIASDLILEPNLVSNFSTSLHDLLLKGTSGNAFELTNSVKDENGLEAWRKIARRYDPRTPGTKRALLMQILNNQCAKKVGEVEANLLNIERLISRYESMTDEANKLPDEVKATVIIALCHRELRDHLELCTGDMMYDKIRAEIMNHVELKRDSIDKNIKHMELDAFRFEYGEQEPWYFDEDAWPSEEITNSGPQMELNYFPKGKGKGKGKSSGFGWAKGQGKGKGQWGNEQSYGGYKGDGKGGYKGGGKGKGGGFQGHCHHCGEFGHSIRNCAHKDKQMQEYRATNGIPEPAPYSGKGGLHAVGTEQNATANGTPQQPNPAQVSNDISALERKGSYRFLSSLSTQKSRDIKLWNRFKSLEDDTEEVESPPGLSLIDYVKPRQGQRAAKDARKTWQRKKVEDHEIRLKPDADPFVPVYLRKPNAEEFIPKGKRAIQINCIEKGQKCSSENMFFQSDEDLYAEKARKQREFLERSEHVLEASVRDAPKEETECGLCGGLDIAAAETIIRELSAVGVNEIEFTVDTGAEETVCNEEDGGDFPIVQGGEESDTVYIMPDGRQVKNKGEKHLKVKSEEGGKFIVRTQVTSVRKPLMSVSKVCDENNIVVFHKTGGYIEHITTKERTHFKRVGNVYVLRLKLVNDETEPPFTRQAR